MTADAEDREMDIAKGFARVLEKFRGRFPQFCWKLDRSRNATYLIASGPESSSSFPVGLVPDRSSPEELERDALRFIDLLLGGRGDVPEFSSWEEMEMWMESVGRGTGNGV
jgi:hypothetical protein